MKQAGIYIRVSTELQGEKVSPQAQYEDCLEYCQQKGYQVVDIYRDTEKYRSGGKMVEPSATRSDRPQFKRMMQDADSGKINLIVAWRLDRITRGAKRLELELFERIKNHVFIVELVKEHFDSNTAPLLSWAAERELAAKHDRFLMGVDGRLKTGKAWNNISPYGYNNVKGVYQVNEEEAEWVKKIWEWAGNKITNGEIRRRLIGGGAKQKTSRGKYAWPSVVIRKILKNDIYYTGILKYKWEAKFYEIPVPAIVDPQTAQKVIEKFASYKAYPAGNLKASALAAGLLYCAACGVRMKIQGRSYKGRKKTYYRKFYRCSNKGRVSPVPGCAKQVGLEKIDNELWDRVWDAITQPGAFENALQAKIEQLQAQEIDASQELERLSKAIDELQMERQRVITWARKGTITEDDLDMQLMGLTLQENELKRDYNDVRFFAGNKAERLAELADMYRQKVQAAIEQINRDDLGPDQARLQFEYRRKIINTFITRVEVQADKTISIFADVDLSVGVIDDHSVC